MHDIELPTEKRVGPLKLLREPRRITTREFNALSSEERLGIIRRSHGRQRYNLLIEAVDAEALLQRMAAQEVYLLIKELGSDRITSYNVCYTKLLRNTRSAAYSEPNSLISR